MLDSMQASGGLSSSSRSNVARFCDKTIQSVIVALAVLMPLFFLPWTIEVVELNKQLLLIAGAAVAGMAWFGKMLVERRVEYRRSIVNVMVLLYALLYVMSAWMSTSKYMSFVGDFGQEKAGVLSLASFVILYFVVANNLNEKEKVSKVLYGLIVGGLVAGVFALLQGFGLYLLPFEFAKTGSFNTVGTVASLGIYATALLSLCGGLLLSDSGNTGRKFFDNGRRALLAVTGVVALALVAAVDFWPVTLPMMIASAIIIGFAFVHAKSVKNISGILLPIAGLVLSILMLFFQLPLKLSFPAEVMPSFKASADIAMSTLREKPFFGSGPGTFIFDYAKYRAAEVNETVFWNVRFDRGASRFITQLATTGYLGGLTWLLMSIFLLISAAKRLIKTDEETWHTLIAVFAAWMVLFVAKFTYSSTLALEFLFWMFTALLIVLHRKETFRAEFEESPRAAMGVSFVFILGAVLVLSGVFVEGQRYAGEIAFANAIRADKAGKDVDEIVSSLTSAVQLNPSNDAYRRNLALAYLAKANAEAQKEVKLDKNEGEKDADYKARVDSAKQDRVKSVTDYTSKAVNTAKAATDIDANNVSNWSVLGSVYQNLVAVTTGADAWAIKSFESAIALEPSNPSAYVELGKVYLYQGDIARQGQDSKDEKVKEDAKKATDELVQKAIDQFNKAVELKSDYAPARYQLSLALDRKGDLKEAIKKMEDVVRLNSQDVGVGFQLALMYYRDTRKDESIRLLESVVRLSPNFSNARWYLAAMYEEKGNLDGAIDQIQKVKELNPEQEVVTKKLEELNAKKSGVAPSAPTEALPAPVEQPTTNQNQPEVKR